MLYLKYSIGMPPDNKCGRPPMQPFQPFIMNFNKKKNQERLSAQRRLRNLLNILVSIDITPRLISPIMYLVGDSWGCRGYFGAPCRVLGAPWFSQEPCSHSIWMSQSTWADVSSPFTLITAAPLLPSRAVLSVSRNVSFDKREGGTGQEGAYYADLGDQA